MRITVDITREVHDTVTRSIAVDVDADDLVSSTLAELLERAVENDDYETVSEDVDCGGADDWQVDLSTVEE